MSRAEHCQAILGFDFCVPVEFCEPYNLNDRIVKLRLDNTALSVGELPYACAIPAT